MAKSGRDIKARIDAAQALYFPTAPPGTTPLGIAAVPFTFTSGTLVLSEVFPGSLVDTANILITQAFNGGGPSLLLGTTTSPSLIMGAADSFPTIVDQYASAAVVPFAIHDFMQLQVNAPGATQGAGLLVYLLKH